MVKSLGKKLPLKLISYDDQSNPATASTLLNQLVTQDKVDILVSDSGSVLTAVAVPIAKEHEMLLFDMTGTGSSLFAKDNPYIVLLGDPVSTIWPKDVADFLKDQGAKDGIKKVALLYATNEFTNTQATAVRNFLKAPGSPIEIVYDQGVPTNTSKYSVMINNIAEANPAAVLSLGYVGNDIAFLRNLGDSGQKFKFLFTIYTGLETDELVKNVGAAGMENVFTYITGVWLANKPEVGMTTAAAAADGLGQGLSRQRRRVRLQFAGRLYDRAGNRPGAGRGGQPGSARFAQGGPGPIRQAQHAGRPFRAGRDGRPDRRDHAARPGRPRRQGQGEDRADLPGGCRHRQADL